MPRLVGLALESAGTEVARDFEIESPIGAVITRVAACSAGEKAGLKPGDLVTTFGESEINDVEDLEARPAPWGVCRRSESAEHRLR